MQEHDENLEVQAQEEVQVEAQVVETAELSATEVAEIEEYNGHPDFAPDVVAKAKELGWREDLEGGLSPGEFTRNQSFFNKIKALKAEKTREVNELTRKLSEVEKRVNEAQRRGFEEGLRALEAQRKEAVRYGNLEEFDRIDSEVQRVRADLSKIPEHTSTTDAHQDPEVLAFFERNPWTRVVTPENSLKLDAANTFEMRLDAARAREGLPPLSYGEKAKQIEEYINLKFPSEVAKPAGKPTAPTVAAASSPSIKVAPDKVSIKDLTDHQKIRFEYMKELNPDFTVAQYIEGLNKAFKR